jgi:cytochrome c oxidase subunit IV
VARSASARYVAVWAALVALTALSFAVTWAGLGGLDLPIALVIAFGKSCLVALFFMHLAEERFSIVLVPLISLLFAILLIGLVVADIVTRRTFPREPLPRGSPGAVDETRWVNRE